MRDILSARFCVLRRRQIRASPVLVASFWRFVSSFHAAGLSGAGLTAPPGRGSMQLPKCRHQLVSGARLLPLTSGGACLQYPETVVAIVRPPPLVEGHLAGRGLPRPKIVHEPVDRHYGIREYGAEDPEGQIRWFASPIG